MTGILIPVQKLPEIPLHTFHLSSCNSMYVIILPPRDSEKTGVFHWAYCFS